LRASTMPAGAEAAALPFNRKYLGSKRLLREWIVDRICEAAPGARPGAPPAVVVDGFCGTGALTVALAARGAARIVAVDNLHSNCVILRGCVAAAGLDQGRARRLLEEMGAAPALEGYITASWADAYFTEENCRRMDGVREAIAQRSAAGSISPEEHDYLLASFLLAADRVANTLGQYDAFLKHIDGASVVGGRHLRDERVRGTFRLQPVAALRGAEITVVAGDMLELAGSIRADAAYYDPPYNGRQYCDNYHVLENLATWEKPPLAGKTRKFDRRGLQSPFSRRSLAAGALRRLVGETAAPHLFLSYSSEGILGQEEILAILGESGEVRRWECAYPVFGNGAGVSVRRSVTERLFHLARGRRA
jgi:adenine-specific DNA-methyltransferase